MIDYINELKLVMPHLNISETKENISKHGCDSWSISIKKRIQGKKDFFPDLVAFPVSESEISELLKWANKLYVPITPWGAGSSVTGAPLSLNGGISLDMSRMDKIINLDRNNLKVTVQAGICGETLENYLNDHMLTLNHSPQSLNRSTTGGWVATRATGQFSSKYGGIEDLVLGMNIIIPNGKIIKIKPSVRPSLGPDLKEIFIGTEGTMGVITEITLKVFPYNNYRIFEAICFDSVLKGIETMQNIMQSGIRPFLLRFYDEDESIHVTKNKSFSGCLMFLGFDGTESVANSEYELAIKFCKTSGGFLLGPELVQDWMLRRFDYSKIEKTINTPGGIAETIEVAHFWTEIYSTYSKLKNTFSENLDEVLGHFSHAYPHGTSLYVILLSEKDTNKSPSDAEIILNDIWRLVYEITSKTGAMAAHHHGVGIARLPIIQKELGTGMYLLKQIKNSLDPSNILCPGKQGLSQI